MTEPTTDPTWITADEIATREGFTVDPRDLLRAQDDVAAWTPAWRPEKVNDLLSLGDYGRMIVDGLRRAVMYQVVYLNLKRTEDGSASRIRANLRVLREEGVQNHSQGGNSTSFGPNPDGKPAHFGQRAWDELRPLLALGRTSLIETAAVLQQGDARYTASYLDDPVWQHRTQPAGIEFGVQIVNPWAGGW